MFFTRIGGVVAWLTAVLGAVNACLGVFVTLNGDAALAAHYFGSRTPGTAIDRGLMLLAFGIALGILVEISRTLHRSDRG